MKLGRCKCGASFVRAGLRRECADCAADTADRKKKARAHARWLRVRHLPRGQRKAKAKQCEKCGLDFQPRSGPQRWCDGCRSGLSQRVAAVCRKCPELIKSGTTSTLCAGCYAERRRKLKNMARRHARLGLPPPLPPCWDCDAMPTPGKRRCETCETERKRAHIQRTTRNTSVQNLRKRQAKLASGWTPRRRGKAEPHPYEARVIAAIQDGVDLDGLRERFGHLEVDVGRLWRQHAVREPGRHLALGGPG